MSTRLILGVKAADVKKPVGLNLLEPCGPVQTCNGTALAFTLKIIPVTIMYKNGKKQ
jgi:hypothetical protein